MELYAIPLQELTCSGKFLCSLKGGGEIDVAEADGMALKPLTVSR